MVVLSCSALDLQRQDLRVIDTNIFRSSVAISPANKSVTAMTVVRSDPGGGNG